MAKLWFQQPAECFEEAIPIGAGRFGAMLYGAPEHEFLQLNEDSVWSGGLRSRLNPDAREGLEEVRSLIRAGKIYEAETLAFQKLQGCPENMRHYMPLGDLHIDLTLPEGEVTDYVRELDLERAVYAVSFRIGGKLFRREVIASAAADCILMRFTAEVPFSLAAHLGGRDDYYDNCRIVKGSDGTALEFAGGSGSDDGIRFEAALAACAESGSAGSLGDRLTVTETQDCTLAFAGYTSYYHPEADRMALARKTVFAALLPGESGWETVLQAHIADYRALFDRVSLTLPGDALADTIPTDKLLTQVKDGDLTGRDALLRLYFLFGRYLMIAGSRKGSLPLNLQGIWNKDMWPAWGSRFTVNINTEMNYWPAENCNLSECHLPLFDLLKRVAENGRITAREMYGLEGFCCHHNTDLWGDTAPQDLWMPATIWPMGGAWLSLHIMEHFRFTQDKAFLRENYEILHEAARFCSGLLSENAHGQLVTCPSVSPENTYRLPNGEQGCLCEGPSMDSQIITQLFHDLLDANAVLGQEDDALSEIIRTQLEKLPRPQIGKYGQIMEWAVDYDEVEPGHRHISQLFALHPTRQITPEKTPELAAAADATLQRRLTHGGGHTGWSCAWIANMYARLRNRAQVLATLTKLMQYSTNPNLFDMHPPFQIDGNFGGTAAIAEALMQSDTDGIRLLPACPAEWHTGAFKGLCAVGGFVIDAEWQRNEIQSITVFARVGGLCRIQAEGNFVLADETGAPLPEGSAAAVRKEAESFWCIEAAPGGTYRLIRQ